MATILIIDDHPDVREVLRIMLEVAGHRVIDAVSGTEGLAAFREHKPDLTMTDLRLPDMEGTDVVHALRQIDRVCPIVMVSAEHLEELEAITLGAKAVPTLSKPFTRQRLLAIVEQALKT